MIIIKIHALVRNVQIKKNKNKPSLAKLKKVEKKTNFLDQSLFSDLHQMSIRPQAKFCGYMFSSFFVILLTNHQVDTGKKQNKTKKKHKLLVGGNNSCTALMYANAMYMSSL